MYAAFYASFGAGAVVATINFDDPGPGVGESTLVLLNLVDMTRFAPGLVLVAAAFAARRILPRWVSIPAGVLMALAIVPITSWVAAALIPVWLGVAGTVQGPRDRTTYS